MSTSFLKKYKIIDKIGEGSFSEVVKCQDRETGELFAAKRLKKTFQTVAEAASIPEVIAMRKMSRHPNILHLLEQHFDEMPGKVTLIFELMDMSMYDLIKNKKRPPSEYRAKNYMYQLLLGCYHLHQNGIFHRDIKPENILMKGDQVKLGDLGSIRGVYSRPPYTEYISTRWYRSPECLLTTGFYGPKMDVWACGCVFYELVTLKPLFPGDDELDQIARIHALLGTPHATIAAKFRRHKSRNCESFFPPKCGPGLHSLLRSLSESGRDLLRHMLIYDPEHRSNIRRLLDHRYFADLREMQVTSGKSSMTSTTPSSSAASVDWRASYNLSMGDRRRISKRSYSCKRAVDDAKMDVTNASLGAAASGMVVGYRMPRQVISSPSQRLTRLPIRRRQPSQDLVQQRPRDGSNGPLPSPARQPARTRLILPSSDRNIRGVHCNQKRKGDPKSSGVALSQTLLSSRRSSVASDQVPASLDELQAASAAAAAAVAAAAAAAAARPSCSRVHIRRGRNAISHTFITNINHPRTSRSDVNSFLPTLSSKTRLRDVDPTVVATLNIKSSASCTEACSQVASKTSLINTPDARHLRLATIQECPLLNRNTTSTVEFPKRTSPLPRGAPFQAMDSRCLMEEGLVYTGASGMAESELRSNRARNVSSLAKRTLPHLQ